MSTEPRPTFAMLIDPDRGVVQSLDLPDAEHIHVTRRPDGTLTAGPSGVTRTRLTSSCATGTAASTRNAPTSAHSRGSRSSPPPNPRTVPVAEPKTVVDVPADPEDGARCE